MPTGITAAIYEGKDVSRDEFLMRVARSFTLAIMQREDDPDAPLKHDEPDHSYHNEEIRESLEFDCGKPGEEMRFYAYPTWLSGADWINEQRAEAKRKIDYCREQIVQRDKVAAERNQHIDAFLRSLDAPSSPSKSRTPHDH
jgi:hypothetical protein